MAGILSILAILSSCLILPAHEAVQAAAGGGIRHQVDVSFLVFANRKIHDKALPISLMRCESLGMLKDRAVASQKLNVYGPLCRRRGARNGQCRYDESTHVFLQLDSPPQYSGRTRLPT